MYEKVRPNNNTKTVKISKKKQQKIQNTQNNSLERFRINKHKNSIPKDKTTQFLHELKEKLKTGFKYTAYFLLILFCYQANIFKKFTKQKNN